MENEFEVIYHPQIKYVNIFMVSTGYRSPHLHREMELLVLLEGRLGLTTKHGDFQADSPSLMLLGFNQVHELKLLDGKQPLILVLQVSPKFFEGIYPAFGNIMFNGTKLDAQLGREHLDTVCEMTVELAYQYFKRNGLYEFTCASILYALFGTLLNRLPHSIISDNERNSEGLKAGRINRIIDYVDENFAHRIQLSDIAKQENLSLTYLSHFFKENMNLSFNNYINTLRFNLAKKLLIEKPNMSLIDVCLQSGYSDSRYMNKAFMQRIGCPPAKYREQHTVEMRKTVVKSPATNEIIWTAEDSLKYLEGYRKRHSQASDGI